MAGHAAQGPQAYPGQARPQLGQKDFIITKNIPKVPKNEKTENNGHVAANVQDRQIKTQGESISPPSNWKKIHV